MSTEHLRVAQELVQARLQSGAMVHFTVPTESMFPVLRVGDVVQVCGFPAAAARPGDIVVSKLGASWRVHRLLEVRDADGRLFFITKGDNALRVDEPWPAEEWVGLVVTIRGKGGKHGLDTSHLRVLNRALAQLSRAQVAVSSQPPSLMRRAALKVLRLVLRGGGHLTRILAGEDSAHRCVLDAYAARSCRMAWISSG